KTKYLQGGQFRMVRRLRIAAACLGLAASLVFGFSHAQDARGLLEAPGTNGVQPAFSVQPVQTPTITNNVPSQARTSNLPSGASAPDERKQPDAEPARKPAPAPARAETNDFQDFIAQTHGERLPLYGYNL